jgi:acetyl-CoA carboxylase biotin carboxyl carrier protein
MSHHSLTDAEVQAILKLLTAADHLNEFRIRYGDIEIAYSRDGGATTLLPAAATAGAAVPTAAPARSPATSPAAAPAPTPPATVAGGVPVTSPMFGTFYRAPAPGATPFVDVGQHVEADSVVCIIEVMKLMNSITASVRGTVRQILVADSQAVQLGQPLVVIEPDA